jgi:heme A synthase
VGALVVSLAALATIGHVLFHHGRTAALRNPSLLLLVLLVVQIALGALTILSGKHYIINSLHVVVGAMVLGTSLVLTLRAWRPRFGVGSDPHTHADSWGQTPIHGSTQGLVPGARA